MSLAARLNNRITIQQQGVEQDATGQVIDNWANLIPDGDGKCWAEVKDISGKEFISGTAEQSSVTTRITIRYRPDVSNMMRVLHGTDVYDVVAVLRQDGRTLQLMCAKGVL
jgi:SPP1 family predicted phage head-tail adaptor